MADATYQKKIPGTKTLPQIARLIHQEEMDFSSAFKDSEIAVIGAQTVNLVTFEEVDISEVPAECGLVPNGQAGPAGATKTWSGTMVASGQTGQVDMYRLPE